jgi:integrase
MPVRKLTALAIPTLPIDDWHDVVMPGLILRVGARRRTWSYRYHAGGSFHRTRLGHYPGMDLKTAREAARALCDRIDSGAPAPAPEPHPRSALTLGALLDKYEAMRLREGRRIKSMPKQMRLLRAQLKPCLPLPAARFSKADLRNIRNDLVEAGKSDTANRMLATIGPALRWAAEEDLIPVNFTSAIRRMPTTKRARVLTAAEIKAIWRACDRLSAAEAGQSYGRLVRFLLVTGQRRDEAASLRHGHILNAVWRQAANKSDRPHSLTLPPLALALVGKGAARDLVFPGRGGGKVAAFSYLKRALDQASGVSDWRLHDLRRTAASSMQELKIRNETVQLILNHAVPGVGGVYLRAELEREKAAALATWAAEIVRIVGPLRVSA